MNNDVKQTLISILVQFLLRKLEKWREPKF
jgi:hypothetical protein